MILLKYIHNQIVRKKEIKWHQSFHQILEYIDYNFPLQKNSLILKMRFHNFRKKQSMSMHKYMVVQQKIKLKPKLTPLTIFQLT